MSKSRARLAADWFAKLRVNQTTQEVEHADVATVEAEVSSYTAEDVLSKVQTVAGSGSGLDADLLDGIDGSAFVRNNNGNQSVSGGFFTNSGLGSAASNTMAANLGTAATTWNNAQLELRNTDAGRVGVTFHRSGYTEISLSHYTSGLLELNGSFTASGNVTAYSDERLKSDIQTIENAVDTVKALRGVTFVKDDKPSLGVIAQEVQAVLPELVMESGDYLSVAYGNMVGVLIEAIKEQQAQIDDLKAKLGA